MSGKNKNIRPCMVPGCIPDDTRYRFPRTAETAEKWKQACQNPRLDTVPSTKLHNSYAVCGKHFARHQFTNCLMNRLNRNTVPTLFLPASDTCSPLDDTAELHVTVTQIGSESIKDESLGSDDGNHFDDTCVQNSDVNEDEHSMSSNCLPSAPTLSSSEETEFFLPKPVISARTVTLLNEYYRYTLCRLCFSSSDHLINIFEEGQECGFLISDAIKDLLQFKVSKTDDFPQFICSSCCLKLCEFREFKESLVKMKEEFEKSLYNLRKGSEEDKNTQESISGEHKSLMVENSEKPKDGNGIKPLTEVKETTEEDFEADYPEVLSDLEEPSTDFEEMEGQDFSEPETGEKIDRNMENIVFQGEHKCFECGEVFQFRNLLTKHYMEHRKTWPVPCQYCDKRFKTLMDLNNHIVMHSNYKPYECEHCGLRCRLKSTLARHKKIHSEDKPFLCSVCGVSFRQRDLLKSHLRMHSGIYSHKCEECGAQFLSNSRLIRHLDSHSNERTHVCGDCGKCYRKRESLQDHITRVHQKEKRFQCGVCFKKYSLKGVLREHMKIHRKKICVSDNILIMT